MLEKLKAAAYDAKLNCGHCVTTHKLEDGTVRVNRCAEGAYCGRWFLHKFRHYAEFRNMPNNRAMVAAWAFPHPSHSA
jgi:hypothetical protein